MRLELFSDPGHAWLKVPKKVLQDLGIADRITPYSYMKGEFAYLEEDMDLGTFVVAWKARYPDNELKFRERVAYERSRVRTYAGYKAEAPDAL